MSIDIGAATPAAILALERAALDRWNAGDPEGYLEISAGDVTYIDPMTEQAITGRDALRAYYAPIVGKINARYEMIDPSIQFAGDAAILSFRLNSYSHEGQPLLRWNSTEVYHRTGEAWKIIHTHWSYTKPELKVQLREF